ncbi:hypothetical protein CPR18618_PPKEINIP_02788 (plasmid) [Companilactobacillus paralimentarius]
MVKPYITANVFFLGNRIKHNTNSSHEFLSALKHIDNVIGVIPEKELVNASMLAKEGILEYATTGLMKIIMFTLFLPFKNYRTYLTALLKKPLKLKKNYKQPIY